MIWIVRTRCVMAGMGREWIHLVRCTTEDWAIATVIAELDIPQTALDIQVRKCERFIHLAEIEKRTWHYTE